VRRAGLGPLLLELRYHARRRYLRHLLGVAHSRRPLLPPLRHPRRRARLPRPSRGFASALPWAVAALALVSLTALVVGQRFGARGNANAPATEVLDGANMQGATPIGPSVDAGGAPAAPRPAHPTSASSPRSSAPSGSTIAS
jgi:hypothetical protein